MSDLLQQAREFLGAMRAIRIHLDEDVVAALQAPCEACEVGLAESLLAGAMQHVDVVIL